MTNYGDNDCNIYGNYCNVDGVGNFQSLNDDTVFDQLPADNAAFDQFPAGNAYVDQSPSGNNAVDLSSATKHCASQVIVGTQLTPYDMITTLARREAAGQSVLPSEAPGIPQDHEMWIRQSMFDHWGILWPAHADCPRINNLPLKVLSFGIVLDATGKLDINAVLTQQRMAVTYLISNNTSLIAGMEPSECIVDDILKSPGIRMMNTRSMVK